MTQKFYSLKAATEAAINAYKSGKLMNPAGFRGNQFLITYTETDAIFNGKDCYIGGHIQATSVPQYFAAVNKVLARGDTLKVGTAKAVGAILSVIVLKGEGIVKASSEIKAGDTSSTNSKIEDETRQDSGNEAEQKEVGDSVSSEIEVSQETTTDQSEQQPVGNTEASENITPKIDWDYARSLKGTEDAKRKLEEYAKSFGHELDRRSTFDGMMTKFWQVAG